jgi:hypothetical protein
MSVQDFVDDDATVFGDLGPIDEDKLIEELIEYTERVDTFVDKCHNYINHTLGRNDLLRSFVRLGVRGEYFQIHGAMCRSLWAKGEIVEEGFRIEFVRSNKMKKAILIERKKPPVDGIYQVLERVLVEETSFRIHMAAKHGVKK